MNIQIINIEEAETPHLLAALNRVVTFTNVREATVIVTPRKPSGWIEYLTRTQFNDGGAITVGVIQRAPGEPVECHS